MDHAGKKTYLARSPARRRLILEIASLLSLEKPAMHRWRAALSGLVLLAATTCVVPAAGQAYPTKPIRMVTPFPPAQVIANIRYSLRAPARSVFESASINSSV